MNPIDPLQQLAWREHGAQAGDLQAEDAGFQAQFHRVSPRYEPVIYPLPLFSASFLDDLVHSGRAVLALILSIPQRIYGGDYAAWLRFQGCPDDEAAFLLPMCTARSIEVATRFARPDCLLTPEAFRIVEMNIAPPIGGIADCDRMVTEFRASPFGRHLAGQGVKAQAPDTLACWGDAVRAVARASAARRGQGVEPLFFEALADPAEVAQANAQHADFVQGIRDSGFRHCKGNVQDLCVRDDGVYFGEQRVDLVFTAFTFSELQTFKVPRRLVLDLVAADAAGLVDFIAPPVNILFDNKCNLELLTSPEYARHWSDAERQLIARTLPLTQRLRQERLSTALEQRESLVLKPTRQFGGAGVVVGANCTDAQWRAELDRALASGEPCVLQETVHELFRLEVDCGGAPVRYEVCAGPMYFGNRDAAVFLRLMPARDGVVPVINAARGARMGVALARRA